MEKIDAQTALRLMTQAMDERGEDYKDPNADAGDGCYYVNETESGALVPGCLVGLALTKHGISLESLYFDEYKNGLAINERPDLDDFMDEDAKSLFRAAQEVQDEGGTWGSAVNTAVEEYESKK